jgi:hypothetical protein
MDLKDIIAIVTAIASLISAVATLIQVVKKRKITIVIKSWGIWISVILTVIFISSTIWLWTTPPADTSRYGFEAGSMGWIPQTYVTDQGIIEVAQSTDRAKLGRHSLKLTADLEGGHPNRSKGEAYMEIPIQNLENKPISVWVYVPKELLGDPAKPNGIQVFVKDGSWRGEYGTWLDITPARADTWFQVTLVPGRLAPPDGYMAPDFDPTQIRAVGVKVAIGEGSTYTYRGPIYVDVVDWPE